MEVPYHPRQGELDCPATAQGLERVFQGVADFASLSVELAQGGTAELYWLVGMARNERLSDYIIRPLATTPLGPHPAKAIQAGGVWTMVAQSPKNLDEACVALTEGSCGIWVEGELLVVPVPTEEKRAISPPEDEPAQKGGKDSFVEAIRTNTSLVRRRLHTWRLRIKSEIVGRESRTRVEVLWVEGITDPDLVDRAMKQLKNLDVDALLGNQQLTDAVTQGARTLVPLVVSTQRPDRFCLGLMEGRVGIFVDGIAQGWLCPGTVGPYFRAPQDQGNQWVVTRGLLAVRWLSVLISLLMPAGYIAMVAFHFGLMPAGLAESISAARQNVPLSPPMEVLMLLVAFEILQEAGLRIPQLTGQSVSIIGSLVVGQAAVEAKLLSPVVVVVVAAAGIAGYTLPDQDLGNALRGERLFLAVLASLFGAVGIVLGLAWTCCHLSELTPLGVPWLAPFAPDVPKTACDISRVPAEKTKLRELFLRPLDKRRRK